MSSRSFFGFTSAWLLAASSTVLLVAHAAAQSASYVEPLNLPAVAAVIDCASLASADISQAVGAPTRIESASVVNDATTASYCKVNAVVDEIGKIEVHLPVSSWKQRLLYGGGMGADAPSNVADFVTISGQDLGHRGDEDAFATDYQLRVSFAYRNVHLQVLATKALISKYYHQAPKFSYFNGCSEPGRKGLMEVQRYPEDFDGTVSGCPPINDTINNGLFYAWNIFANTGSDGKLIITADKLPILHEAVLGECDAADGLKDGIVSDPLNCHPKLTEIECKPGQDAGKCLTSAQIHAALELYRGAHDEKDGKLTPIGVLPGSELQWTKVIAPEPPQTGRPAFSMDRDGTVYALRSEFTDPPLGTNWKLSDLKFDRASFDTFTKMHYLFDATDPDLSAYAKAGHKLILWQGLEDSNVLPAHLILYYTALQKQMGAQAVDHFARFYALPGVGHCGGGEGPSIKDFLTPLMLWVERGIAPGSLMASHVSGGSSFGPQARAGAAQAAPDLTRPIYPYPYKAKYKGTGESKDADNFEQGPAINVPADLFQWFGSGFYTPGYEKWCTGVGATFNCKSSL